MKKIGSLISVLLLVSLMTACGKNRAEEMGTAGDTETIPAADTVESAQETLPVPDNEDSYLLLCGKDRVYCHREFL
ncbi:MAG: hypothetical protein K2N15_05280 [Lachnospiraceae bacterium]|nr:hypothetical protein [Lachnospiraceae bacterium]